MNSYEKIKKQVEEEIAKNNYDEAFMIFREIIHYPSLINNKNWVEAFGIFEQLSQHFTDEKFVQLVKAVKNEPDNIQALYDLAYQLYEQGAYRIAATVLSHANQLYPGEEAIVTELASNLEAIFLNNEACQILKNTPKILEESDICKYLFAFNSLMCGNIDTAKKYNELVKNSKDENIQYMYHSLLAILNRADVLKERLSLKESLREWHMVLNGDFLLHLSPHGFKDGMNGRYAYVSDSYSLIKEGILKLIALFNKADIDVPYIYYLPNKNSEILALALSKLWNNKPVYPYKEETQNLGLVVAYDLKDIDSNATYEQLSTFNPGQYLWSHASCWTDPFPYSPDITTFLYQFNANPWDEGMKMNEQTGEIEDVVLDSSSNEEIAEKIIKEEIDEQFFKDEDQLLSMLDNLKKLNSKFAAGLFKNSQRRYHNRTGSPIKSSTFG